MIQLVVVAVLSLYIWGFAEPCPEADSLYQAQKYREAAQTYMNCLPFVPLDGRSFYRLAVSMEEIRQLEDAMTYFRKADSLGFAKANVRYAIGSLIARKSQVSLAISWLDSAYAAGYADFDGMVHDTDLMYLRDKPEWEAFLERTERKLRPCKFDERYRQFDFWVGDWDVSLTSNGALVGHNVVSVEQNGCLLREEWRSMNGHIGTSTNFFNPETQKWNQIWISESGDYTFYEGELKDSVMQFLGRNFDFNVMEWQAMRMTFTPNEDGSVRQFIEIQEAGSGEWSAWFDGTYRKTK